MLIYLLDLSPHDTTRWQGWRVSKPSRGRYCETRVTIEDLSTLPDDCRVYLCGVPWRRG